MEKYNYFFNAAVISKMDKIMSIGSNLRNQLPSHILPFTPTYAFHPVCKIL